MESDDIISSSLVNIEGIHGILIKNTNEIKAAIILPRKRHYYDDSFAARSRQVMREKLKIGAMDQTLVITKKYRTKITSYNALNKFRTDSWISIIE